MHRSLLLVLIGGVIGLGMGWGLGLHSKDEGGELVATPVNSVACDPRELDRQKAEVVRLQSELRLSGRGHGVNTTPTDQAQAGVAAGGVAGAASADKDPSGSSQAIRWRISAIEKFVPLTDDQRERLREKYEWEGKQGESSEVESLEAIIGEESAAYYRGQVQAAFKRARDEEIDREVVWLSRKLSLSADQERGLQGVLMRAEEEISDRRSHSEGSRSPQERVAAMIQENQRKAELKNQELQRILTPDQYQAYLRMEAESAASDVEMFHEPPTTPPTPED